MNPQNIPSEKKYTCSECKLGTPDLKEENMSIEGKPTLIICSLRPWPKHLVSERACEDFQLC